MNKTELIQQTAAQAGLSRKDAEAAVNAALDVVTKALAEGDKIQIVGFGSFETKERAARTARNPRTLEPVEIPASRTVAFHAGKGLKDAVAL
ncbi:MAG: HU family DNA-binding protein [Oscillospiraceae bacterium]|nr:HU family DNA-binding protein [Oscillospiraceae bacterium]MBR1845879.1 HU family DNA-binding protein [Oscillospiraceae bacterium]